MYYCGSNWLFYLILQCWGWNLGPCTGYASALQLSRAQPCHFTDEDTESLRDLIISFKSHSWREQRQATEENQSPPWAHFTLEMATVKVPVLTVVFHVWVHVRVCACTPQGISIADLGHCMPDSPRLHPFPLPCFAFNQAFLSAFGSFPGHTEQSTWPRSCRP